MHVPLMLPISYPLPIVRVVVVPVKKERVPALPRERINRAKFELFAHGIKPGKAFINALQAFQDEGEFIRCFDCFIPMLDPICVPFSLFLTRNDAYPGLYRLRFGDLSGPDTAISHLVEIAESEALDRLSPRHRESFSRLLENAIIALSDVSHQVEAF